ncbi:MAG TPA: lysylphosphatidylglycerol synthase transmembrane domain-containing protein [Gemmatimonadaceae bacterium]|nr:lysylphosphatidylglycerol synthase transmembrane domain-containing protein [Gemmatimonadaceae bacterium]
MTGKIRGAIGILLSVALLWWALHDVHWGEVVEHLGRSSIFLFLVATVMATLIFPLRARRWQILLEPVAGKLPLGMLWRAVAVGIAISNVVPARAGELARAYALTRETPRVRFSAAFASVALDRVFDAFIVLSLLLVAMMDPAFPRGQMVVGQPASYWLVVGASAVGIALVGLYLIVFFPERLVRLFDAVARRISPKLAERGRHALLAFAGGLGVLRDPRRFLATLWWTLLHWLLNSAAYVVAFKAMSIDAPFTAALFFQGIVAIGVSVPSAPGFFGVFEAIAKATLPIYGVSETLAVSWAIAFHILSFLPITIIGLYYFARLGMHMGDLKRAQTDAAGEPTSVPSSGAEASAPSATR